MKTGSHLAEFEITGAAWIGIARPMPDQDVGAYEGHGFHWFRAGCFPDFPTHRSDDWGDGNVHA